MGKKAPTAPAPPDPFKTAQAQAGMNKETAIAEANLNRINQYTPEGSLEFEQIGVNADGTPRYQSTQKYSEGQQKLYDNELAVSNALSGLSLENVGRVSEAQKNPFSYEGMTPLQTQIGQPGVTTGYDTGGAINRGYQQGDVTSNYANGGDIASGYDQAGKQIGEYGSGGDIQRQYDFNNLTALPGAGDYGAEAKRVQDAVYNQATSRLDPRMETEQRQLAAQLANKGVSENSEAYRRAMDQFARQKTDAYNQATYSGIQAGGQEQSRLFGLSLQGRQQGANEAMAQGQFGNSAQAQAEAQAAARAGFGNAAQAEQNRQNYQSAAFGNAAQQQRTQQAQEAAQFYNQAQGQFTDQNAAQAQFGNSAQAQQNAQNMGQAAFGNQAAGQIFGMNAQNATFNNEARQQQIQEEAYRRNLPLNEISALMGAAGGVSAPQFAKYAQPGINDTDYSGLVKNNYDQQMAIYNQQMQQRNSGLGAIFGLAGKLGAAAISDRRVKHSVNAIGKLANGLQTYVFSYLGSKAREFGVMADEVIKVIPRAVIIRPDGLMMVDYRKVW